MTKEEEYLKIYSFDKINGFQEIADEENISKEQAKNDYKSINHYIGTKLGITKEEADKLQNKLKLKIQEIQKIFSNKFKQEREEEFDGSFKDFYDWFKSQDKECFYCKIKQNEIDDIFNQKVITSKKFNSTLHIEKKDSEGDYKKDNMVLACALCNNAKSDMISQKDYEKYFAKSMREYLSQCKNKANA